MPNVLFLVKFDLVRVPFVFSSNAKDFFHTYHLLTYRMAIQAETSENHDNKPPPKHSAIVACLPGAPVSESQFQHLYSSVLVNSAFVALCLGDNLIAFQYATQVLALSEISGAHRYYDLSTILKLYLRTKSGRMFFKRLPLYFSVVLLSYVKVMLLKRAWYV